MSPDDLERPATANGVPGAAPWRAKDHLAHLVQNERNIQQELRRILAGETGMPDNVVPLTPEEEELAASVRTPSGDEIVGGLFVGRAEHATDHITWIEESR